MYILPKDPSKQLSSHRQTVPRLKPGYRLLDVSGARSSSTLLAFSSLAFPVIGFFCFLALPRENVELRNRE